MIRVKHINIFFALACELMDVIDRCQYITYYVGGKHSHKSNHFRIFP